MEKTKTRLLDSAERILSRGGFTALSLRPVTAEAGVSLSAVNYHFRSKDELIHQVFARRLDPLNRERLAALDECESRARGKPVPLDELLHAFIGPFMKLSQEGSEFVGLIGRMYSEPSLDIQRIFGAELVEVVKRFSTAFRRALPETPPDDIFYSLFFTTGAMLQALGAPTLLKFISGGLCDPSNLEMLESQLTRFAKAGLSTNPSKQRKKRK